MRRRAGCPWAGLRLVGVVLLVQAALMVGTAARSDAATEAPADAIALDVPSGGPLAVTLAAGEVGTTAITLVNRTSDTRFDIRVLAKPIGDDDSADAGSKDAADAAARDGPTDWVTVVDAMNTLEPGASAPVPLRVTVPYDALPGERVVRLVARAERAFRVTDNQPTIAAGETSVEFRVVVRGEDDARVSVTDARVVESDGKRVLAVELRNNGDSPARVAGTVVIATKPEQRVQFEVLVDARDDHVEKLDWKVDSPDTGTSVTVDVAYGSDNSATWSGVVDADEPKEEPPSSRASPTVATKPQRASWTRFVAPTAAVLVAVAAVAWLLAEMRRSKRRRLAALAALPADERRVGERRAVGRRVDDVAIAQLQRRVAELEHTIDEVVRTKDAAGAASASSPAAGSSGVSGTVRSVFAADAGTLEKRGGYPFDWPTEADLARFNEERARSRDAY
jgi:hypothetical protein